MIVLPEKFSSRQKYLPLNALADKTNQITIPLWTILINNTRSKWARITKENSTRFITFERPLNFIQFLYYTDVKLYLSKPRKYSDLAPS